jgi:hypothetical protein
VGHFLPRLFVCNLRTRSDCARQPGGLSAMLMGSKPPSSIGTTELWRVNAFTWRNDLRQNAQTLSGCQCAMGACPGADALRSHGSHENTCNIVPCKVDVNMLSYDYGQTYDQTHDGSFGATRQTSYRDHQASLWVSIRRGSNPIGYQDGSQAGGHPTQTTSKGLASIPVNVLDKSALYVRGLTLDLIKEKSNISPATVGSCIGAAAPFKGITYEYR